MTNIFSRFKRKSRTGTSVLMQDLFVERTEKKEMKDDHSDIADAAKTSSQSLSFDEEVVPQIPVIGVGGAGCNLVNNIATRVRSYNIQYNTMGVDINDPSLEKQEYIETKYAMESDMNSTSKQYLKGQTIAKKNRDILQQRISSYLAKLQLSNSNDIVFLFLGAGGTGVGVSIEIIEILLSMGKRPVPILVLPSDEENTRIKFNAAVALYKFSYAPKDRCFDLVTLIIDNELFMKNNSDTSLSSCLAAINERVAATFADIVISTELKSHGYNTTLNEFIEIFRNIKGIGCFTYLHNSEEVKLDKYFSDNMGKSLSLECDIYSGTRAFMFVQSSKEQLTSLEYRTFLNDFGNIDIFPKLNEFGTEKFFAVRGAVTGINIPPRIKTLMEFAEDVRITLVEKEISNSKEGKGNPKIDKYEGDLELDVKKREEEEI